ncbi:MAG TPA: DUF3667 domain-containing protein [Cryomorphaceae bacterium]|nr:DUF3667 domain-containing protein [Cryomorphaceae bacterium]
MNQFPTEEEPLDVTEVRKVKRITMKQVLHSAVDAFNIERGGIYTIKRLLIDPGATVLDYLGANRYHYTPPFRILIFTTAIALFLIGVAEFTEQAATDFSNGYNSSVEENSNDPDKSRQALESMIHLMEEVQGYTNLILWTFIPFSALFTWLINLKRKFNYAEHIVFQTYLFCLSNMLSFLFPLDHFIPSWVIFLVVWILMLFYYVYGYKQFLNKSWLRSFFEMSFIVIFSIVIWSVLLGFSLGLYVLIDTNTL